MGTVLGKRLAATPLEAVAASSRMERKREDFGKHPDLDRLQPNTMHGAALRLSFAAGLRVPACKQGALRCL